MGKLNFGFDTIPGQESYIPGSEPTTDFFFIAIVTEGMKEEIDYLSYIEDLIKEQKGLRFKIILLNKFYTDTTLAISDSHPKKRLEVLKEWRKLVSESFDKKDEEWIVCDRDDRSFKEDQYDALCKESESSNFKIVISNPAFQIWLLFHFVKDITCLNLDKIEHSKQRLKVVEAELKKHVRGYRHGTIKMQYFATHIREAIDNSLCYPHDLNSLKTLSGTNFSDLLISLEERAGMTLFR